MANTIAVIFSSAFFVLLGLGAAYVATNRLGNLPDRLDEAMMSTLIPTALGAVFGLVVGCVAVVLGNRSKRDK